MTGCDFDWMVSNHAVWGWKAPVKASVSGVSFLQLPSFFASIFPLFPQKRLILRLLTIVLLDAYQSKLSYFVAVILWAQTPLLKAAASFSQPRVCVVLFLIFYHVSSAQFVTCSSRL